MGKLLRKENSLCFQVGKGLKQSHEQDFFHNDHQQAIKLILAQFFAQNSANDQNLHIL